MGVMEFLVCGVTGVHKPLQNVSKWPNCAKCFFSLLWHWKHYWSILVTIKPSSMIQNIMFSHIHLMGGRRGFHTLLGGHIEILSCDKTLQNSNHYTKMTYWSEFQTRLLLSFNILILYVRSGGGSTGGCRGGSLALLMTAFSRRGGWASDCLTFRLPIHVTVFRLWPTKHNAMHKCYQI